MAIEFFITAVGRTSSGITRFLIHRHLGVGRITPGIIWNEQKLAEQLKSVHQDKYFTANWNYKTRTWEKGAELVTYERKHSFLSNNPFSPLSALTPPQVRSAKDFLKDNNLEHLIDLEDLGL
ncbi:MAG: hypothetical protein J7527_01720 [Chitinophagaceae bacterium]|nr:hypothetical protein [Chitinophagaceae bacterium]